MPAIQAVVEQIQDAMGALEGMKSAPDSPPESIDAFPFAVSYEGPGSWDYYAGGKRWLGQIYTELHVARKDLPRDIQQIAFYSDKVPGAIISEFVSDQLGMTADALIRIESSGLVVLQYQTTSGVGEHLGILYKTNVKLISNLS
jgi:hypothetical protein